MSTILLTIEENESASAYGKEIDSKGTERKRAPDKQSTDGEVVEKLRKAVDKLASDL